MEPKIAIDTWYQEKNGGEKKEKKEKGEKGIRRKKCFWGHRERAVRARARPTCGYLTSLMYNLIQQVVQPHFSTFCEFDLEYNYTVQLVVRGCISTTTLLEIDK